MKNQIVTKEAFRIVGMKERIQMNNPDSIAKIPAMWGDAIQNGLIGNLKKKNDIEPQGVLGVCVWADQNEFDYLLAVASGQPASDNECEFVIPGGMWAVFESDGALPEAIQSVQNHAFFEWLPSSTYAYDRGTDVEYYPGGDLQSPDYRAEVWMPVKCK
jgi:AraC family transcriptional regulator